MPSYAAVQHDERHSVRPYVLAFCFLWGLIFGFVFYLTNSATGSNPEQVAEQPPETEEQPVATEGSEPEPVAESSKRSVTEEPPAQRMIEIPDGPVTEKRRLDPDPVPTPKAETAERHLVESAPPPSRPLHLRPDWGLTGRSIAAPPKPISLDKPVPKSDIPPPIPDEELRLDDDKLPELDL